MEDLSVFTSKSLYALPFISRLRPTFTEYVKAPYTDNRTRLQSQLAMVSVGG